MTITVTCSHCNASLRLKDEMAGKRGKCPRCQSTLEVPQPAKKTEAKPAELVVVGDTPAEKAQAAPKKTRATANNGPPPKRPAAAAPSRTAPAAAVPDGLVLVPDSDQTASEPGGLSPQQIQQVRKKVLGAFQSGIEPVDVPLTYRLGILLVAVVMVLLPLIYLGLIALTGYGVYLHAIHNTGILSAARGRGAILALLVYLTPIITGGILVLFMIKPLFARPAKQGRTRSLTRQGEPLLFAFVDRVCEIVGSARPKRIDIDCQVNASASFRRGFLSMLGNDLVLTIGMPLAAGLNLRQFAGVLGHEFGHFAQGAGMRLTYVIRSISWWFTRVVYERDAWDERLTDLAKGLDLRISWVLHLARLMVWLTRKILWVLMIVGHAVSGFMLRQMEFDADRHEARLAGSDTFETTARQLMVLNVAMQGAQADLEEFYRDGRLGDNLPRLVMANVSQIPDQLRQKLNAHIDESTTGWLDTHPADKDRIASARRENAPGVFRMTEPAGLLFADFRALAKNATWDFYRGIFGPQFKPSEMHSTEDLLRRQGREQEAGKALDRYFQGSHTSLRPLPLPDTAPAAPANPAECAAALREARQQMLDAKGGFDTAFEQFDKADSSLLEAEQAAVLLKANFRVRPADFNVSMTDKNQAATVRREALAQQNQLSADLTAMEKAAVRRLRCGLQLLYIPKVAKRIDNAGQLQKDCKRIYSALVFLNTQHQALLDLRNAHSALAILLNNIEGNEENESLINSIRAMAEKVLRQTRSLRDSLMNHPYPLDHAKGEITIAQYALEKIPTSEDLGGIYGAAGEILEKLPPLYSRMTARMVVVGQQVEQLLGLPPLPEPEKKEEPAEGDD